MKKTLLFCLVLLLFFSCKSEDIDISGKWKWTFENNYSETHQSTVQLNSIEKDRVVGFYCSAYGNGNYVDCAGGDSELKNVSNLELKRVSPVKFEGTIRSNRSVETNLKGKIEVTYFPATDQLFFDIIEEPGEEFYFPDEVEFERMKIEAN